MTKSNYKLTKEDFKQINRRSLFTFQLGWNYERMQGSGYLYTILPQLRKIYGDDTPELKEMMKTHTQFFNTSNFFNTIITGIDLAIEEKEGVSSKETISGMKAGLMGSFAAIGDSVFAALIPTIFGALAANMATDGNPSRYPYLDPCSGRCHGLSLETTRICLQRRDFSSYHDAITLDCIDRCGYFTRSFHGWSVSSNHDQC